MEVLVKCQSEGLLEGVSRVVYHDKNNDIDKPDCAF